MAAPTVAAISTASDNNGTNATFTVPLPTGSAAGRMVIVSAEARSSTAVLTLTGWTQAQQDNGAGAMGTWSKALTSGDVTTGSVTISSTVGAKWAGGAVLLSSDAATTVDVSSTNKSTTNTTSFVANTVTTTGADRILLAFFSTTNGSGSLGVASGMTSEQWEVFPGVPGTTVPVHACDDGVQATAGATGNKTATNTVSATFIAHLVAVGPSAAAKSLVTENRLVRRNSLLRR